MLGTEPEVYAVYTVRGGTKQESTSVRVTAQVTGLEELLTQSVGAELPAAGDVRPRSKVWLLAGISLGCTAAAALVTVGVMRLYGDLRRKKSRSSRRRGK